MPRATSGVSAPVRFPLRSLPATDGEEEGWVELRKLTYGQVLERRDMAGKMAVNMPSSGRGKDDDMKAMIDMANSVATAYEFKHSIVAHNLYDENDKLLNFGDPTVIDRLDPAVGQEIANLINDMNEFDADLVGKDSRTLEEESAPV